MYIAEEAPVVETFKSSCGERIGLWITIAGIIGLGIVSCVYNFLLDTTATSAINAYFL